MARSPEDWSEIKAATNDIQSVCDTVKSQAEEKWTKKTYEEFKAVEYREQIVREKLFLIKVRVGGSDCLHIYASKSPPQGGKTEIKLKRVEEHKAEDPLNPIRPVH